LHSLFQTGFIPAHPDPFLSFLVFAAAAYIAQSHELPRQTSFNRRVCRLSPTVEDTVATFLNIDKVFPTRLIPADIGLSGCGRRDTYIVSLERTGL